MTANKAVAQPRRSPCVKATCNSVVDSATGLRERDNCTMRDGAEDTDERAGIFLISSMTDVHGACGEDVPGLPCS
jgi:hypothetical protein